MAIIPANSTAAAASDGMKIVQVGVFHHFKRQAASMLNKRTGIALMSLASKISYYTMNVGFGDPAQDISVLLDSGSGNMWVPSAASGADHEHTFDASKSSSFKKLNEDFSVGYVSSKASGHWGTDQITVGPWHIPKYKFGVVDESDTGTIGIAGVGFSGQDDPDKSAMQNIPAALQKAGKISKQVFSLFLDDLYSSKGSIIFGGLDTSKYTGTLWELPLTDKGAFEVEVTSMQVGPTQYKLSDKPRVRVDSGSSLCYLPKYVMDEVGKQVGAKKDESSGLYYVSSQQLKKHGNPDITFNFNGATIKVPCNEIFLDSKYYGKQNPPADRFLGILPSSETSNVNILGDVFLRSAYAVFDIDNKKLGLAQAKLGGNTKSEFYEITDRIPFTKQPPGDSLYQ